jgi:hypothetical protein
MVRLDFWAAPEPTEWVPQALAGGAHLGNLSTIDANKTDDG